MNIIEKVYDFYSQFKGEKGIIGYTEEGREIPFIKVVKSSFPTLIIQYGIHAREHITSHLALAQIRDFIVRGKKGAVYFIPAVNVDGINIALKEKPLYKANSRGVDLNVNFDARWGEGALNTCEKGDENFIGDSPFSESETRAIRDFTLKVMPTATVSYHAKGEEIYWHFYQDEEREKRDFLLARNLAIKTGYALKKTPNSAGGYKDWCIEKLGIPSFTIEVGKEEYSHPVCQKYLLEIYLKNREVINTLIKDLGEQYARKVYENGNKRGVKSKG